jgi:hypothetical protein
VEGKGHSPIWGTILGFSWRDWKNLSGKLVSWPGSKYRLLPREPTFSVLQISTQPSFIVEQKPHMVTHAYLNFIHKWASAWCDAVATPNASCPYCGRRKYPAESHHVTLVNLTVTLQMSTLVRSIHTTKCEYTGPLSWHMQGLTGLIWCRFKNVTYSSSKQYRHFIMEQLISFEIPSFDASWLTRFLFKSSPKDYLSWHFTWVFSVPPYKCHDSTPNLVITTSFHILPNLSFNTIQSQILTAPLNKPYIYLKYPYITILCLSCSVHLHFVFPCQLQVQPNIRFST